MITIYLALQFHFYIGYLGRRNSHNHESPLAVVGMKNCLDLDAAIGALPGANRVFICTDAFVVRTLLDDFIVPVALSCTQLEGHCLFWGSSWACGGDDEVEILTTSGAEYGLEIDRRSRSASGATPGRPDAPADVVTVMTDFPGG